MQDYESVSELLIAKNEFVEALKQNDKETAKSKLLLMKELYKKATGKDMQNMFSEAEWEIIGNALGEKNINNIISPKKGHYTEDYDDYEK